MWAIASDLAFLNGCFRSRRKNENIFYSILLFWQLSPEHFCYDMTTEGLKARFSIIPIYDDQKYMSWTN